MSQAKWPHPNWDLHMMLVTGAIHVLCITCDYISTLRLKLIHVSKQAPMYDFVQAHCG